MPTGKISGREFKKKVLELVSSNNFEQDLGTLCKLPARKVINPLFSFLLSTDSKTKWATVTAFGAVVSHLAEQDMESARVIMRRMMWQLNDESGGIGWGCPEAMGEIIACHEGLAREYARVLISYIREDGNFLEHEPLQEGALWGIGRVAQVRPNWVRDAVPHLHPFLEARDATLRGLAAWALGLLGAREARSQMERLANDGDRIAIYRDRKIKICLVKDLAKEALEKTGQ
jgi:hypothetical protein